MLLLWRIRPAEAQEQKGERERERQEREETRNRTAEERGGKKTGESAHTKHTPRRDGQPADTATEKQSRNKEKADEISSQHI
jgi:hypothetical protein